MPLKSQLCGIARMHAGALNSPQSLPKNGARDHGARTFNATTDAAAHAGRGRRGARAGHRGGGGVIRGTGELVTGRPPARDRDDPPAGAGRRGHRDGTQADRARLPTDQPAGTPLSRDEFLGGVDAGVVDFLVSEPSSPIAVRLSGDSATLRYQTAFDVVAGGTHVTHQAWTTALYERRDGRWQIVWEQSTAIPNNLDLFIESIKPVS